ncbi:anhydro-N-acetylmuramic acid kinase [Fodinicola acaciae]|uniref:anhydro-N-acetylmuramic acid kinase n=1 Tax=Fodinicola acaciae TaxID=2681555 RepID=UPI0013D11E7F|nr:anhydro-N-acetylmuramic acid kinase [Fodinicola acaciae]
MRVVGLMSGTSYDGIDVAVAELELAGDEIVMTPVTDRQVAYDRAITERIADILPPAQTTIEQVCQLDALLGQAYAQAAAGHGADLVVSHGQTVFHWVDDGRVGGTLQLGQPAWIAAHTGAPVISDLRSADIAAGGQGAPLVPAFDALLLGTDKPRAALNLGGIANATIIRDGSVIGYDIGPANALIDLAARKFFDESYDRDGQHASRGHIDERLLNDLLAEPYYRRQPPKSTGKELFHLGYLNRHLRSEPAEDVLATLTELTARTVADELDRHGITEVVASGGGVRNPELMARLRRLTSAAIGSIDDLGIPSDAKEAYAFAVLGFLSWHGLPAAVPSVTGARTARILGSYTPGSGPLRLPEPRTHAPTRLRIR